MARLCGAAAAVLALLYGLSAAPYTHAHHAIDSVSDEHHPHGATLVHTHASPHSHHDAGDPGSEPSSDEERGEHVWPADGFVFPQPASNQAPAPVLVLLDEPHVPLTGIWFGPHPPSPRAHAPPLGAPSGLRAPPACPPPFV